MLSLSTGPPTLMVVPSTVSEGSAAAPATDMPEVLPMPVCAIHSALRAWQLAVCDDLIHRLGLTNTPSGTSLRASASTPLMPLLALDTTSAIRLPAIRLPLAKRKVCIGAAMLLHHSGVATTMSS